MFAAIRDTFAHPAAPSPRGQLLRAEYPALFLPDRASLRRLRGQRLRLARVLPSGPLAYHLPLQAATAQGDFFREFHQTHERTRDQDGQLASRARINPTEHNSFSNKK